MPLWWPKCVQANALIGQHYDVNKQVKIFCSLSKKFLLYWNISALQFKAKPAALNYLTIYMYM